MAMIPGRRTLLLSALAGVAAMALPRGARGAARMTAAELVASIRRHVGIAWREDTVDRIVAGAADTPVRGIATTMVATLDVLRRAADAGLNFVVAHEPTFFDHFDEASLFEGDATYAAKRALIARHDLVVFRFHDHWHLREPDGIDAGMARALGWEANAVAGKPGEYAFDAVPLREFAQGLAERLGAASVRVLGDPALPVRRVAANWGYANWDAQRVALAARDDIDVLVVGEAREWELVAYLQDRVASGARKGLVVVGHVASEQAGMRECARWLRSFVGDIPVEFIATAEPFWTLPPVE